MLLKISIILLVILNCLNVNCISPVCYNLELVLGGLKNAVALDFIDQNKLLIAEQIGVLKLFDLNTKEIQVFLNLTSHVLSSSDTMEERGLLGLTLDPSFQKNHFLYVFYSTASKSSFADHDNVVSRFEVFEENGIFKGKLASGLEILRIEQPGRRQNGGQLFFNIDNHLYITTGNSEDKTNSRLHKNTFLGKILRINVQQSSKIQRYRIPENNPFNYENGQKSEVYAYGFFNPWRCVVDQEVTVSKEMGISKIYCGDVGDTTCNEENLYIIERGGRYGWWSDSSIPCNISSKSKFTDHRQQSDQLPIHTYKHDEGQAVVGGIIYRGQQFRELFGHFIFADYVHGSFHTLENQNEQWVTENLCIKYNSKFGLQDDCPHVIAIHQSLDGEVLVLTNTQMNSYELTAAIYKFSSVSSSYGFDLCSRSHHTSIIYFIIIFLKLAKHIQDAM